MSANTNKRLVAIVTGASSGMGLGITRALLERGYPVVANSRTISQSRKLKPSADLVLVDGDIGKEETAVKVVDAALKQRAEPERSDLRYLRKAGCREEGRCCGPWARLD